MASPLAIAIPTCSQRASDIRIGYVLEALALQPPSKHFESLEIFIWDEGAVPMTADRWVQLTLDLLVRRGHRPTYMRRGPSRGVAEARMNLVNAIPASHDRILFIDDDLVPAPGSLDALLDAAARRGSFGFLQGSKVELDSTRTYLNDINCLTEESGNAGLRPLYFGDAAFLLLQRDALRHVQWEIVTRFTEEGLPGEDVAMTLMIADREPCFGVPAAVGYHMSLATPRWRWEVPSDILQFELLKEVVSAKTLERALPHLSKYLGTKAACGAADQLPGGARP
jgi:hypothetical protein